MCVVLGMRDSSYVCGTGENGASRLCVCVCVGAPSLFRRVLLAARAQLEPVSVVRLFCNFSHSTIAAGMVWC